jgi:cbb3-type cytochrome oxidase subunit 3
VSGIRYTVIFAGTEIEPTTTASVPATEPETEPMTETEPESEQTTEPESDTSAIIESEDDKKSGFNWIFVIIPLALLIAALIAGIIYMYLKKRKEQTAYEEENEENFDYDYIGNDYNDSGGDPGDGDEI